MKTERFCWWCGKRLQSTHAEVAIPNSPDKVWTHKICEKYAKEFFRQITAQEKGPVGAKE